VLHTVSEIAVQADCKCCVAAQVEQGRQTATALHLAPDVSATRWELWRGVSDQLNSLSFSHTQLVFALDHLDRCDVSCHAVLQRLFSSTLSSGFVTFLAAVRSSELSRLSGLLSELADLRVDLSPLELNEVEEYVDSLVQKAGGKADVFSRDAVMRVHAIAQGLPRQINRLCELCLLAAMADDQERINGDLVDTVAEGLVTSFEPEGIASRQHQFV